ncbi:MAG: heme ABC transporter ATP-binding protein [Porticoccus sp.]|jgi:iron complex transport system ATP-binding protein|uniref:heme ABC transporter ATP-binding protein n=1 Tax=Porticoccus hydrocarbonoclasticus TaxID=1073414 RepID=UPI00056D1E8D|nr:heme ABC transporter ATP-binding protein [Porticoccus hydrocarbonoclasticus]MBG57567.1 heme ABC transporter ATP-binding protein [Porticoccus sp.]|tara:strand:- start:4694 stop:5464 length:771 start_codon:yes stop_codon:yes gene_type:complete
MLEAQGLSFSIAGFSLLRDIDLRVEPGKVTAIIGPNGAGKTSLLRLLTGEQRSTAGNIALSGRPLGDWSPTQLASVMAVLPQSSRLDFPFTAREVVMMGRIPHATGLVRDTAIVDAALAAVDGSYLDKRFYTHMSGGEKQRVQLARVLAQIWEPVTDHARVLILDEPTSSFDLAHQQLTITNMRSFAAQGVGVLVVIHDLNMAARCADQLLVLSCGRIAAFGSPQQVLTATTIKQVFNVDVSIGINPLTGTPLVIA